jgi:hypothetical protein
MREMNGGGIKSALGVSGQISITEDGAIITLSR